MVRLLKEHGAFSLLDHDVSKQDEQVYLACETGNIVKMRHLLEIKASPNWANLSRRTALHKAAKRGNEDMVKLLLRFQADANMQDKNECTAFDQASQEHRMGVLEILAAAECAGPTQVKVEGGEVTSDKRAKRARAHTYG